MNYKFKYFLYYTCVFSAVFIGAIILAAIVEIITTKSFAITVDLPNIHFVFLGILLFSFLVSYTYIPFVAKPSVETYVFNDETEKVYILKKIDDIIKKASKDSNVLNRKKVEIIENKRIYASGIKILDFVIQPIIVKSSENSIILDASCYFTKKINAELKEYKKL